MLSHPSVSFLPLPILCAWLHDTCCPKCLTYTGTSAHMHAHFQKPQEPNNSSQGTLPRPYLPAIQPASSRWQLHCHSSSPHPGSGRPCRQHFSPWQEQILLLHTSAGTLALPIASGNRQGNSVCPVKSGASHPPSLPQCPSFVKSLPEWKCLVCGQTGTGTAASSAKEWRKGYLHQDISYAQHFRHCRALGSLTYLHDLLVEGNPLLVETLDPGLCCESVLVLFIERREMFCVTCLVIFFWVVFSCKINNHLSAYPFLSPPKHFSLYSHLHKHRIQRRIKGFAVSSHKCIAEYRTTPRGFRKENKTGLWGKLSHNFLSAGCPMLWNSR